MYKLILMLTGILGIVISISKPVQAQSISRDQSFIQFSLWGGYSFNSVKLIGQTSDSQTSILGIGIKKKMKSYENGNLLLYTADLIPFVEYHYPKRDENNKRTIRSGFGFSPIGFQLQKTSNNTFHPFIKTSGGFLYMNKTFPTDEARRLNFTFDLTIGTDVLVFNNNALTLGYKFHHISNAQTGDENPGLDSNFLFISLQF